jgi:hypothetical protein
MKANASVFAPNVRLNQAVRDFSAIPARLLGWYEAVFQSGDRTKPPSPFDKGVATPKAAQVLRVTTTAKSGLLIHEKLVGYAQDSVVRTFPSGVALLASGSLIDLGTKRQISTAASRDCEVVRMPSGWLIAELKNHAVSLRHIAEGTLRENKLPFNTTAQGILGSGDRIFLVTDLGLTEVKTHILSATKVIASVGETWGVLVNSTRWFSGVGVQNGLGAMFAILPFGEASVTQVRVRELDALRVVNAKAGHRFASFVAVNKSGGYVRLDLTFDRDYTSYTATQVDVDQPELNMAILPKGVVAAIEEDGVLLISVPTNKVANRIEDKQVSTDMVLSNWGDRVTYIQNGTVWSLRMN